MIDPYLFFAPILLLGIVALLRFVGCGFSPSIADPTAPNTLTATAGNAQIALTWQESDQGTTNYSYQVSRSDINNAATVIATVVADTSFNDTGLINGTKYTYTVTATEYGVTSGISNQASATPAALLGRPPGSVLDPSSALATNLIGLFIMNNPTGTLDLQPADDTNLVDMTPATHAGASPPTWEVADPSILFHGGVALNSNLNAGVDASFNDMPTDKLTIVAKIQATALTAGGICEKNDGKPPNSDSGFLFAMNNNGALHLTVEFNVTSLRIQTMDAAVTAGQWMQVAFTWDGTQYDSATKTGPASAASIYVNQVLQTNAVANNGTGTLDTSHLSNGQPFRIGNASYDLQGSWNGKMAYVAVYKGRILTIAELAMLDAALPIKAA